MSILAGVGTAGVPGGSLPLIVVLMIQVGIPAEGIGLILGVDRFLDMCRTTLNVAGDLVIAKLITETAGQGHRQTERGLTLVPDHFLSGTNQTLQDTAPGYNPGLFF